MIRSVIVFVIPGKICTVSPHLPRILLDSRKFNSLCSSSHYLSWCTSPKLSVLTPTISHRSAREMSRQTGDGQARMTRDTVIKSERDKYINMSPTEKRALYRCGSRFQTVDCIATWPEYVRAHHEKLGDLSCKDAHVEVNHKLNSKVSIWRGDITHLEIDSVVNAANGSLLGGGGVDGAIHSAAGKQLYKECVTLGGCDTGQAKVTAGYKLPAKYIVHTVGPVGVNPSKLQACYSNSLKHLLENNIRSIAFPCISTGVYGYPNGPACGVALKTIREWLEKGDNADKVDRIIFCLFLPVDVEEYESQMKLYFPFDKETLKEPPNELNLPEVPEFAQEVFEDNVRGDGDGDSGTEEKPPSPASASRHRSPPAPSDSPEYKKKSASAAAPNDRSRADDDVRDKSKPDGAPAKEK